MYGYLIVSKVDRERVTFPDGSYTVVDLTQGADAATRWQAELAASGDSAIAEAQNRHRSAHEEAVAAWQAELDAHVASVAIRSKRQHAREAFEREHPRPVAS